MKFAHLADCHLGAWRESKLRDVNTKAFVKAIETCIEKEVDFILISGDLFNTPLPSLENLKVTVSMLKKLKDKDIPVYITAGSHDFSPSGKTMLDVLEEAGLIINVCKGEEILGKLRLRFTVDKKTGAKITGMLGKKGSLEKSYYESLDHENLEGEDGYKIFMFHSALTEFKPSEMKDMESHPLSLLPKGFNYYAGGHVHYVFEKQEEEYGHIAFPGPIFPNNFSELEKLERGGFYLVEVSEFSGTNLTWLPIQVYNIDSFNIDCNNKTVEEVYSDLKKDFENKEFINTIVLIRLHGTLSSGKISDLDFKEIYNILYEKGAYFVMRNTNKLKTKEFEEIKIDIKSTNEIEDNLISEHVGKIKVGNMSNDMEKQLTIEMMRLLSQEKGEMTKNDFENKIKEEVDKTLLVR